VRFSNSVIESYGYHLPDQIVSSSDLEERLSPIYDRLRLPQGRLELMTGIKQRRLWPPNKRPSDIATTAAKNCLTAQKIDPQEIDILIHASVCRDFLEPATASVVHNNLGLSPHCQAFDLSNACLGVLNAMTIIAGMIEQGVISRGMVVSGENGGPLIEETIKTLNSDLSITRKSVKKYIANLTIGSAAVAYTLTKRELAPEGHALLGGANLTDSTASNLCQGDGNTGSLMMETDSTKLLAAGVKLATQCWQKTVQELTVDANFVPDWVIGHQVGREHKEQMMRALNLYDTPSFDTFETLGNTGSAALPITLAKLAESGQIQPGQQLALLGIGSGLSSTMLGVTW
jgi:acyl-CoA:acyl-CoA alkyltransferase